jgi:hypothetical protein
MRNKRRNGGGYMDGPGYVNPGNLVHNKYSGPGMDCAGSVTRPGYLTSNSFAGTGGLPGLNGKLFGGKSASKDAALEPTTVGGATQLGSGGIVAGASVQEAFRGGIAGAGSYGSRTTTGAAAELKEMGPTMVGGRYGSAVFEGPLNPMNGVGTTPGPFGRVHCEAGTRDPLNPNPGGVQSITTAPNYVAGWSHYLPNFLKGGKRRTRKTSGGAQLSPAPLTVTVGDVNSMRYNAPTAGYSNFPLAPPVMNNPGILMQTPYDARAFNMACLKTGGGISKNGLVTAPKNYEKMPQAMPVPQPRKLIAPKVGLNKLSKKNKPVANPNIEMERQEANAAAAAAAPPAAAAAAPVAANSEPNQMELEGGAYPVAAMAGSFTPVTIADYKTGMLPVKFGGKTRKTRHGGAFVSFNPSQLPMTPGMPVAAQAGNFPNFQRIPIGHYIDGSSINNPPVSKPAAGGARKNRKNRKDKK